MYCSKCGNEIYSEQIFCSVCGNNLSVTSQNSELLASSQLGSSVQMTSKIRQDEMRQMDDLIAYFSLKRQQYEEYDFMIDRIIERSKSKYGRALGFGIPLLAIGVTGIHEALITNPMIVILPILSMCVGASLIALFTICNIIRSRKLKDDLKRHSELEVELFAHYNAYGNCPIGPEYTNPSNLIAIKRTIISGRADTVKEAINTMIEDDHRANMEEISLRTEMYAATAAKYAKTAAVFSVAGFFLDMI